MADGAEVPTRIPKIQGWEWAWQGTFGMSSARFQLPLMNVYVNAVGRLSQAKVRYLLAYM